jgi:hypothetical protein
MSLSPSPSQTTTRNNKQIGVGMRKKKGINKEEK